MKIFDNVMLISTIPTTLFQIFCKTSLKSKIIVKSILDQDDNFCSIIMKIFDNEMLIRTLLTTILQIFCKIILNSKIIVKSILDPDDNFCRN